MFVCYCIVKLLPTIKLAYNSLNRESTYGKTNEDRQLNKNRKKKTINKIRILKLKYLWVDCYQVISCIYFWFSDVT